jgi:sigma-E factor negative regulatory protein RseA
MKDRLSQLMDGELDDKSASELIANLSRDSEGAETWRAYHLVGDLMRGTAPLSEGFAARVAWKLADEPTVLAPGRIKPQPRQWFTLSAAAASLAAVAFVGWFAFGPQPQTPAPVAQARPEAKPSVVPLPPATNDYLLAHQGFSPRVFIAPYVRTVSEQVVEPKK